MKQKLITALEREIERNDDLPELQKWFDKSLTIVKALPDDYEGDGMSAEELEAWGIKTREDFIKIKQ